MSNNLYKKVRTIDGSTSKVNVADTIVSCNIPMYPRFSPKDIDMAYGVTFLEKYYPKIYDEYLSILNGETTYGTNKKDVLNLGLKIPKAEPSTLAQAFLNKVLPMAIWRYLMLSINLTNTDEDGNNYVQDYDFPMFQYNFPDEKVINTGNLVDPDYSDNGVEDIPLQMTYNPIFYELQTQLQRSQYFSIDNGEILKDFGGIENDSNAQSSINIVYNPPGANSKKPIRSEPCAKEYRELDNI